MDTVPTHSAASPIPARTESPSPLSVTAPTLCSLAGSARWPQVVDVRKSPAWNASPHRIAGALRCAPDAIDTVRAGLDVTRPVICVCVHGHEVSQGAAARLRALGLDARFLEGGIEAWLAAGGSQTRSLALLPMRVGAAPESFGLLVLGSPDPARFQASMGTAYLERIAETASAALSRLLA